MHLNIFMEVLSSKRATSQPSLDAAAEPSETASVRVAASFAFAYFEDPTVEDKRGTMELPSDNVIDEDVALSGKINASATHAPDSERNSPLHVEDGMEDAGGVPMSLLVTESQSIDSDRSVPKSHTGSDGAQPERTPHASVEQETFSELETDKAYDPHDESVSVDRVQRDLPNNDVADVGVRESADEETSVLSPAPTTHQVSEPRGIHAPGESVNVPHLENTADHDAEVKSRNTVHGEEVATDHAYEGLEHKNPSEGQKTWERDPVSFTATKLLEVSTDHAVDSQAIGSNAEIDRADPMSALPSVAVRADSIGGSTITDNGNSRAKDGVHVPSPGFNPNPAADGGATPRDRDQNPNEFRADNRTPSSAPISQAVVTGPVNVTAPVHIDAKSFEPDGDPHAEKIAGPIGEVNPTGASNSSTYISPTARVEPAQVARVITQSVVEIVRNPNGGTIEIGLSPEELGGVRLSVQAAEGGVTVAVMADRAETLDLLRRHIGMLEQELNQIGYSDIAFDFGRSGDGYANEHERLKEQLAGASSSEKATDETPVPLPATEPSPDRGLDLRL